MPGVPKVTFVVSRSVLSERRRLNQAVTTPETIDNQRYLWKMRLVLMFLTTFLFFRHDFSILIASGVPELT